jgi:hypothetical protein
MNKGFWRGFSIGSKGALNALVAAATLGLGSAYAAQTITHTAALPLAFTDWSNSLSIPRFDASLGSLLSVQLTVNGTNVTATRIENKDTKAWDVKTGSDVFLVITDPFGAELVTQAPHVEFLNQLGAFDLVEDFGGTSGATNPEQTSTTESIFNFAAPADDLSPYIGLGNLSYAADAFGSSVFEGPGDYTFVVSTRAAVGLTVVYTYEPSIIIPLGSLGDRVWYDKNKDGVQDDVLDEPGLVGWTVTLKNSAGIELGSKLTGVNGTYLFEGLEYGQYTVIVTPPADAQNYVQTYDLNDATGPFTTPNASVATVSDATPNRRDVDFGYVLPTPLGSLGDRVWLDADSDKVQDPGEQGLVGWKVELFDATTGTKLNETSTGADGIYTFTDLPVGSYRVTVTPEPNYGQTYDLDGIATAHTAVAALTLNQAGNDVVDRTDVDFGYVFCPPPPVLGSIGDRVWKDYNADGVQDGNEPGLSGWTVQLIQNGSVINTKTTSTSGTYLFTGLPAGDYTVKVTRKAGYSQTYDLDGLLSPDIAIDVPLAAGQNRRDVDFGYVCQTICFPSGCGCTPGFWSNRGLGYIRPEDYAALSTLKLVNSNGTDADFVNPLTGAFGAPFSANLAQAKSSFATYEGSQNAVNMATQLSRHLAAFVLNVRFGFVSNTKVVSISSTIRASGKITAAELIVLANDALIADSFTPSGDANRAYQERLKNALACVNEATCRTGYYVTTSCTAGGSHTGGCYTGGTPTGGCYTSGSVPNPTPTPNCYTRTRCYSGYGSSSSFGGKCR